MMLNHVYIYIQIVVFPDVMLSVDSCNIDTWLNLTPAFYLVLLHVIAFICVVLHVTEMKLFCFQGKTENYFNEDNSPLKLDPYSVTVTSKLSDGRQIQVRDIEVTRERVCHVYISSLESIKMPSSS